MTTLKSALIAVALCFSATSAYAQSVTPAPSMQPPPVSQPAPAPPPPPPPAMTTAAPSLSGYTPPEDVTGAAELELLREGSAYTPPEDVDSQDPMKQKNPGYSPPED